VERDSNGDGRDDVWRVLRQDDPSHADMYAVLIDLANWEARPLIAGNTGVTNESVHNNFDRM